MEDELKLGVIKTKEPRKKKVSETAEKENQRYIECVGRRKTATARVRLFQTGDKSITVNGKDYKTYFSDPAGQNTVSAPLEVMKQGDKFKITAQVLGGGVTAQAEAIRHGIARALEEFNPEFRKRLKKVGYLTRDPRMRERKKFGLKRARKAAQWAKR